MRSLYEQLLGSQPINAEWADSWALFEAGGTQFALHAIPAAIAESIVIDSPPEAREDSPVKLIFRVEDAEAEQKRLEGLGFTILSRPWQGAEEFDCLDLEGNVLQFSSRQS